MFKNHFSNAHRVIHAIGRRHGRHGFDHGHGFGSGFGGGGFMSGRKLGSAELQLVLLALLAEQPAHGYELIRKLEERSGGFYAPSPGMIYPALTYLEEIGHAEATPEGNRKLFTITEAGSTHLAAHKDEADAMLSALQRVGGRMAEVRDAFAGLGDADPQASDDLHRARHELKHVLMRKRGSTPDEARRIAKILARATAEILGKPNKEQMMSETSTMPGPIPDPKLRAFLARLSQDWVRQREDGLRGNAAFSNDPHQHAEHAFPISPDQGELIYLLCRAIKAKRVVEFATSTGFSTLHFAAALRDNGGGTVIGSEIVPAKVATARARLEEARLSSFAEIREGDARETLRDLGGKVDFALIDGWPLADGGPTLARQVTEIIAPQIRIGGFLMNDNAEPDFLDFIRDPANGFISMTSPLKGRTELSVRIT